MSAGFPPVARLDALAVREEQPEAFLREREEDVVLAREVAVDRGRAVLDPVGDLPDRHFLVAVGDEQLARGVEDRPEHGLPVPFLSFFDSQVLIPLWFTSYYTVDD